MVEPCFLRAEFSRWHRRCTSRQTHNDWRFCCQPQSYLCSICLYLAWAIPDIPQLDTVGVHECGHMALPPPSLTGGSVLEAALRPGIQRILPAREKVYLSKA